MKPSAVLRSLSSRIPARLLSSPAVAPLPSRSRFDQLVTPELTSCCCSSLTFLVDALSASAAAQKIALHSLPNILSDRRSPPLIDEYLDEGSTHLLDACRDLSETLVVIRNYSHSLQVALQSLLRAIRFPPTTAAALARASRVLDSCHDQLAMKRSAAGSRLSRRLISHQNNNKNKLADHALIKTTPSDELGEILAGSTAIASTVIHILGMALSFKSKRRFSTLVNSRPTTSSSWSWSLHQLHKGLEEEMKKKSRSKSGRFLMLSELRETIMAAEQLRIQINNHNNKQHMNELGPIVEELKTRCEALDQVIRPLEEKVDHLYRNLISLRMALLGPDSL